MKSGFWYRAYHLYADGFRQMTLGRTLWAVVVVKLIVIFAVLKVFFFPDYLKHHAGSGGEAQFVSEELINRSPGQTQQPHPQPLSKGRGEYIVLH